MSNPRISISLHVEQPLLSPTICRFLHFSAIDIGLVCETRHCESHCSFAQPAVAQIQCTCMKGGGVCSRWGWQKVRLQPVNGSSGWEGSLEHLQNLSARAQYATFVSCIIVNLRGRQISSNHCFSLNMNDHVDSFIGAGLPLTVAEIPAVTYYTICRLALR